MLHGTLMNPGIQIEHSRFKVETRALAIKKEPFSRYMLRYKICNDFSLKLYLKHIQSS